MRPIISPNLPLSDATPLVNRAKGRGAEILCCLSFFDDAVMIMRAAKNINYNPKLIFQQLASIVPAWMTELGEDGNNVVNSAFWHARLPFPGNSEINEGARTRLGIPAGPLFFGFGYYIRGGCTGSRDLRPEEGKGLS
jgi:ABC-type branched-subunit amino acid transport system substrate-binding protein